MFVHSYCPLSQKLLEKSTKRLYKRKVKLNLVSYHFRLIRDSYLEIALMYFYLKKPKRKVSGTPSSLKVTAVFRGIRSL